MYVIWASTPDQALQFGVSLLKQFGEAESSRNGAVLVMPTPVTTVFDSPLARVSFAPERDANPFFHLYEALWMLGGRNDLASMTNYVARFGDFSDDGKTLHGAYGFRWRGWFEYDQLQAIIDELATNPASRRAVLTMWDASDDLHKACQGGKDVPCNTQAYFRIRYDAAGPVLDMTVTCRSNDMVWGAYGANVVHFSMLLEYMASAIGVKVGRYYQVSNNFHAYVERPDVARLFEGAGYHTTYDSYKGVSKPLMPERQSQFDNDLARFLDGTMGEGDPKSSFFSTVAVPMQAAYNCYKRGGELDRAISFLKRAPSSDWALAGIAWLERRAAKRATTQEVR